MTGTKHNQRRSLRLKNYDYAQAGAYYVTLVTQGRVCLFGGVIDGEMQPNEAGLLVRRAWNDLPNHYANASLDEFVVMPNHIHGVIVLNDAELSGRAGAGAGAGVVAGLRPALSARPQKIHALPEIIRAFKSFSARRINESRSNTGGSIWQRNYYEHVIRNEEELNGIREYIAANPQNWEDDSENVDRIAIVR